MSFRPLHDRVLVSRLEAKETTKGGIIIPGTAQEKPIEGKVVAVGSGLRTPEGKIIPLDVQVGDIVVFNKWSGTELTVDGNEYLVMKEADITGILDSTAAQKAA